MQENVITDLEIVCRKVTTGASTYSQRPLWMRIIGMYLNLMLSPEFLDIFGLGS